MSLGSDSSTDSSTARLPQAYEHQVNVLKVLRRRGMPAKGAANKDSNKDTKDAIATMDLNEITTLTGHTDEREVQRVLYILEGHRLVTPLPPGDLTSRSWKITPEGLQALIKLEQS